MNRTTAVVIVLVIALALAAFWFYPWLGLAFLNWQAMLAAAYWLAIGLVLGHLGK